jgi:hypothetical protein
MKDLVDQSIGIVTRIVEALARIKPTEPLSLDKREARNKRNCSDSSGNSPSKILGSRCACKRPIFVYYESIKRNLKTKIYGMSVL